MSGRKPEKSPDPALTDEQWHRLREVAEHLNYDDPCTSSDEVHRTEPQFTLPVPEVDPDFRNISTVYVVRSLDYVKIGTSRNVRTRLRGLIGHTPFEIELIAVFRGGRKLEKELHVYFDEYHHRDEWFRLEGRLQNWVERGCKS